MTAPTAHKPTIRRILIADDEEAVCVLIKIQLEAMGITTLLAQTGQSALEVLQEGAVDAVISDQDMPGMKGTELYKRACVLHPHLRDRFIFISGNSNYLAEDFPCQLIHKPFELETLSDAVRSMLGEPKRAQLAGC